MNNASRKGTCAIYVRVSTELKSQKDSPEHQRMFCEERAKHEGLQVSYVYEDRSTGTSILKREEVQKMIEDASKGLFDTIIFASLSRFSREMVGALNMKRILEEKYGIRLIAIQELYDSAVDQGEFKFQLMTSVNQMLSDQTSLSVRRGIRQSAKKGNFTGSRAPYGYEKTNINGRKTLNVVDEKAETVRQIYQWYVHHHMGEKAIVNTLNEQGIPSPMGGVWQVTTVQRILQNQAYTGRNVFGKYTVKKVYDGDLISHEHSKKLVAKNKDEWEKNEELNWEPIISDELFQDAQNVRLKRGGGTRGGRRNVRNILSGLIKCSHCGSSLVIAKSGKTAKSGREYRYLVCSLNKRAGEHGCINKIWIPFEQLVEDILSFVKTNLKKKIDIDEVVESQNQTLERKPVSSIEERMKEYERKLKKLRTEFFELRRDLKSGEIDQEQFEFEKDVIEKEIKRIEHLISLIKKEEEVATNKDHVKKEVRKALEKLVKLDIDNKDELRFILQTVIEEIIVDKEGTIEVFTPFGPLEQ